MPLSSICISVLHSVYIPVLPSHPQPRSPNFSSWRWQSGAASPSWSSSSSSSCPAGGARRGIRGSGKETRRLPAKREKTPQCGKTKTKTEGEEEGDRERNRRTTHFLSRSPSNSGDQACAAPSWGLGLFSYWTFNFLLPLGSQTWTIVDGQLSLTRDKSRMCLCVGNSEL